MANAISARIKKMIAPVPPPNVQESQIPPAQPTPKPHESKSKHPKQELVMVIPPGIGKHVIGKNGRAINNIKDKCKVEIETAKAGTGDEARVTISGRPACIEQANAQINTIISYQLDIQEEEKAMKKKKETAICTYFLTGNCRYGHSCWKIHPKQPTATSRSRSRSPTRRSNQPNEPTTRHENFRNPRPRQAQISPRHSPKHRSSSRRTTSTPSRDYRRSTHRSPNRTSSRTTRGKKDQKEVNLQPDARKKEGEKGTTYPGQ